LESNDLFSTTSNFKKGGEGQQWGHPSHYNSYTGNFNQGRLTQIDYIFVRRAHKCRVKNAEIAQKLMIDSDHHPVTCEINVAYKLKSRQPKTPRKKQLNFKINDEEIGNELLMKYRGIVNALMAENEDPSTLIEKISEALREAAEKVLPEKDKARKEWYTFNGSMIKQLEIDREQCIQEWKDAPHNHEKRANLKNAHKAIVNAMGAAMDAHVWVEIEKVNDLAGKHYPARAVWEALRRIEAGLTPWRARKEPQYRKVDGTLCEDSKEKVQALKIAHEATFNANLELDPGWQQNVIDTMAEYHVMNDLDGDLEKEEIISCCHVLKNNKAPGTDEVPAELYKYLTMHGNEEDRDLFCEAMRRWWDGENPPESWKWGKMVPIAKPGGDHLNAGDTRPILLQNAFQRIASAIINKRLQKLMKVVGIEEQNGFTPNKGCPDAIFSLTRALEKRAEHEQGTWALFLDIVKAFDRVPRACLWAVLQRYGVPPKLLGRIQNLYENTKIEISVGDEKDFINSNTGVKQGDNLSPTLFIFVMQAALETLKDLEQWPEGGNPIFFWNKDGTTVGKNWRIQSGKEFTYSGSCYADDNVFIYDSREALMAGTNIIFDHFLKFGLEMHVGRNGRRSKTEAMYCPPDSELLLEEDMPEDIDVGGGSIHFTTKFKYLGTWISNKGGSQLAIKERICLGHAALAKLRRIFRNKWIQPKTKSFAYQGIVLPLLLWGCESWTISESSMRDLKVFHNRAMRCILWPHRETFCHVEKKWISAKKANEEAHVMDIESYIAARILPWIGRMAVMEEHRHPRMLLSSYLKYPRNPHGQRLRWGRSIERQFIFKRCLKHPQAGEFPIIAEILKKGMSPGYRKAHRIHAPENDWLDLANDPETWKVVMALAMNKEIPTYMVDRNPSHVSRVFAAQQPDGAANANVPGEDDGNGQPPGPPPPPAPPHPPALLLNEQHGLDAPQINNGIPPPPPPHGGAAPLQATVASDEEDSDDSTDRWSKQVSRRHKKTLRTEDKRRTRLENSWGCKLGRGADSDTGSNNNDEELMETEARIDASVEEIVKTRVDKNAIAADAAAAAAATTTTAAAADADADIAAAANVDADADEREKSFNIESSRRKRERQTPPMKESLTLINEVNQFVIPLQHKDHKDWLKEEESSEEETHSDSEDTTNSEAGSKETKEQRGPDSPTGILGNLCSCPISHQTAAQPISDISPQARPTSSPTRTKRKRGTGRVGETRVEIKRKKTVRLTMEEAQEREREKMILKWEEYEARKKVKKKAPTTTTRSTQVHIGRDRKSAGGKPTHRQPNG